MHFLPWWALLAGLAASAIVAYLLLGRTQARGSRWALFVLTAVAAPVLLAGAVAAAIVLSTLLSAYLEDRTAAPKGSPRSPAQAERTGAEAINEGTDLRTISETTATATGYPSASSRASPSAPFSASASP